MTQPAEVQANRANVRPGRRCRIKNSTYQDTSSAYMNLAGTIRSLPFSSNGTTWKCSVEMDKPKTIREVAINRLVITSPVDEVTPEEAHYCPECGSSETVKAGGRGGDRRKCSACGKGYRDYSIRVEPRIPAPSMWTWGQQEFKLVFRLKDCPEIFALPISTGWQGTVGKSIAVIKTTAKILSAQIVNPTDKECHEATATAVGWKTAEYIRTLRADYPNGFLHGELLHNTERIAEIRASVGSDVNIKQDDLGELVRRLA